MPITIRKNMNKTYTLIALTLIIFLCNGNLLFAQGEKTTIQLSGIVVDGDSTYGIPGVHVYIPRAGIGTTTNRAGMFSIPALSGYTVIISAVSYKPQRLIVPKRNDLGMAILIDLKTDTTFLPVVEVFPYPTPEQFKEAFLALELPDDGSEALAKNLDPEMMTRMAMAMPMSSASNYRYQMNQHINNMSNRFFSPTFSFLNPFAWANFVKSVKKGDLKSKDKK